MHPALGLGLGHTLHAVNAALVLEGTVDTLARHLEYYLLISAGSALGLAVDLELPSLALAVLGIHAEKVPGEDCRLVPSCTAADLHYSIFLILRILGDEQELDLLLHAGQLPLY